MDRRFFLLGAAGWSTALAGCGAFDPTGAASRDRAAPSPEGARLAVRSATVPDRYVAPGDELVVRLRVENSGTESGRTTVPVTVDGATAATPAVSVPAGATRTATASTTFEKTGAHEVAVGGRSLGTVRVLPAGYRTYRCNPRRTGRTPEDGPDDPGIAWRVRNAGGSFQRFLVGGDRLYTVRGSTDPTVLRERVEAYPLGADAPDWTFEVEGYGLSTPPALVDGTLYVTASRPHQHGVVHALDAATGERQWNRKVPTIGGPPAVDTDAVYVSHPSWGVTALGRDSGEIRWTRRLGAFATAPSVGDGSVYVTTRSRPELGVASLSAATGEVEWSWSRVLPSSIISAPVVGEYVYLNTPGGLAAHDPATGERAWTAPEGGYDAPALGDGTAYFCNDYQSVVAVDTSTGDEVWRTDLDRMVTDAGPVCTGNRVYVVAGTGDVFALDAATGDVVWRVPGSGTALGIGPVVYDESVFVARSPNHSGADQSVVRLEDGGERIPDPPPQTRERWRTEADRQITTRPQVGDGTVYVGDDAGVVYAFDWREGRELWRYDDPRGGGIRGQELVDAVLYFGTENREFYALEVADGSPGDLRWRLGDVDDPTRPAVDEDRVYFGAGDRIRAVDRDTGATVWTTAVGNSGIDATAPVLRDGTLYTSLAGAMVALDPTDGSERWRFDADESRGTRVTVGPEVAVFGASSFKNRKLVGDTFVVDRESGEKRFGLGTITRVRPAVESGTVWVGDEADGGVYAYDAGSGEQVAAAPDVGPVQERPLIGDETLYVFAAPSVVLALDAASLDREWTYELRTGEGFYREGLLADGRLLVPGVRSLVSLSR